MSRRRKTVGVNTSTLLLELTAGTRTITANP